MSWRERAQPFLNPLCVALDVDSKEQALRLVSDLKGIAGGFKIGPRLLLRYGQEFVQEISQQAPVFIDCKFFDIPSTMKAAVRATFAAGACLTTVHAMAGAEALAELARLEKELSAQRPFRILAVTILTSWSQESLPPVMKIRPIATHVQELAQLTIDAGLSGLVCSAEELDLIANISAYKVTPGIRFSLEEKGDQKRTLTPVEALQKGSSLLVVGRPIVEAKNPFEVANKYLAALAEKPDNQ
jgi:orotidine-5'-phosphate decarboxylase